MQNTQNAETKLTRALFPRLNRRAAKLMNDQAEAEDIVQETLIRVLEMRRKADMQNPEAYAMITLHNLAKRRWRAAALTDRLEDPDCVSTPSTAPTRLLCSEIAEAIDQLPTDQACLMRDVMKGETSPSKLARKAGCPVGTVNSRLARARQTLRQATGIGPDSPVADLL